MEEQRRPRSAWTFVAIGCGSCFVLVAIVLSVFAWSGFRFARSFTESAGSPEEREKAVLSLLHADKLPPGYYAVGSLNIPMVMKLAVISNHPPSPGGAIETGDRALYYARASAMFAIDRREEQTLMELAGIEVSEDASLAEGVLEIIGGELRYHRHAGELTFQGTTQAGVITTMAIRCHGSNDFQAAVWIEPAEPPSPSETPPSETPEPERPDAESLLLAFLEPFQFCPNP